MNFSLNGWILTDLNSVRFFNRNYLVTLPAQLVFPSTQKVCLDLSPGYDAVKFTVTLETKDRILTLLRQSGLKTRHLHCRSFLVSAVWAQLWCPAFPFSSLGTHQNLSLSMFSVVVLFPWPWSLSLLNLHAWPCLLISFFPFFLSTCEWPYPSYLHLTHFFSFPLPLGFRAVDSVSPSLLLLPRASLSWPGTTSCGWERRSGHRPGVGNWKGYQLWGEEKGSNSEAAEWPLYTNWQTCVQPRAER